MVLETELKHSSSISAQQKLDHSMITPCCSDGSKDEIKEKVKETKGKPGNIRKKSFKKGGFKKLSIVVNNHFKNDMQDGEREPSSILHPRQFL